MTTPTSGRADDARQVSVTTYLREDLRQKLEVVARAEGLGIAPFLRRLVIQVVRDHERFTADGARAR